MSRKGLPGYWDSAYVALDCFDHELMHHYGFDPDLPKVQMVHKKLEVALEQLKEVEWAIDELDEEYERQGGYGG